MVLYQSVFFSSGDVCRWVFSSGIMSVFPVFIGQYLPCSLVRLAPGYADLQTVFIELMCQISSQHSSSHYIVSSEGTLTFYY